jgi:hypothetical protein
MKYNQNRSERIRAKQQARTIWEQRVGFKKYLNNWPQDEAATGPDQIYELSDGAVDSRDTLELEWGFSFSTIYLFCLTEI